MIFKKRDVKSEGPSGQMFLKIGDGESKTVIFRGEVFEYFTKWEGGRGIVTTSSDPLGKPRFRVNAIIFEEGKFQPRIFEFGVPVYNLLAELEEEYGLGKTKIKIIRKGVKLNTTYTLLPIVKEPLTPGVLNQLDAVELLILNKAAAPVPPAKVENDFGIEFGDPGPEFDEHGLNF